VVVFVFFACIRSRNVRPPGAEEFREIQRQVEPVTTLMVHDEGVRTHPEELVQVLVAVMGYGGTERLSFSFGKSQIR
jgi:hypothetical protein